MFEIEDDAGFLHCRYTGVLMAKLPFEPPPLVRKLSQRGLDSPHVDDCAFVSLI